jgi:1,4-dihydroxy-2-naphthoate octaprenyltransferase
MDEVKRLQTKNRWAVWLAAARPKTLPAAGAPVVIGTALAYGDGALHVGAAVAALLSAVLIQIGTNFHNDYADYSSGADTRERKGPLRVTNAGLVSLPAMKRATILVFAAAVLVGGYLIWRGGWPIALIGVCSVVSALWYSATSFSLARIGLADLFVLIFFGPVAVGGTFYVQALDLTTAAVVAGLGPGLISVALLEVNNLRDVNEDRKADKRTLAVRFGASFARTLYSTCLLGAYLLPIGIYLLSDHHAWTALVILTVPLAHEAIETLYSYEDPRTLNDVLETTGKFLATYSLLFSIGWIL